MAVEDIKLAVFSFQLAVGRKKEWAVGRWQEERVGSWQLAVGSWQLAGRKSWQEERVGRKKELAGEEVGSWAVD